MYIIELRFFLGLCNVYRCFVSNFARKKSTLKYIVEEEATGEVGFHWWKKGRSRRAKTFTQPTNTRFAVRKRPVWNWNRCMRQTGRMCTAADPKVWQGPTANSILVLDAKRRWEEIRHSATEVFGSILRTLVTQTICRKMSILCPHRPSGPEAHSGSVRVQGWPRTMKITTKRIQF